MRKQILQIVSDPNFILKILATNWGFNGTLDEYCANLKKEGYDGIEIWWPNDAKGQTELSALLKKYNLEVGFLCGGHQQNWKEHLDYFKQAVNSAGTNTSQKPLYINCHSGRDFLAMKKTRLLLILLPKYRKKQEF